MRSITTTADVMRTWDAVHEKAQPASASDPFELGDVTQWYVNNAKAPAIAAALAKAKIECVEMPNTDKGEPFMNRLIGAPSRTYKTWRITWNGKTYALPIHSMPRDVWFVLRGITMAQ